MIDLDLSQTTEVIPMLAGIATMFVIIVRATHPTELVATDAATVLPAKGLSPLEKVLETDLARGFHRPHVSARLSPDA